MQVTLWYKITRQCVGMDRQTNKQNKHTSKSVILYVSVQGIYTTTVYGTGKMWRFTSTERQYNQQVATVKYSIRMLFATTRRTTLIDSGKLNDKVTFSTWNLFSHLFILKWVVERISINSNTFFVHHFMRNFKCNVFRRSWLLVLIILFINSSQFGRPLPPDRGNGKHWKLH